MFECRADSRGTMMLQTALFAVIGAVAVAAVPTESAQRIVGGEVTTIDRYPYGVAMLNSLTGLVYLQSCGGTLINNRSVLTAAHCFLIYRWAFQWRSRVGSSFANSGGVTYDTAEIIRHPNFGTLSLDNDFAIVRVEGSVALGNNIQPASIAGPTYNPGDNQEVWAIGWGTTCSNCASSSELRHVQVWTVNLEVCKQRYAELNMAVTDNMLCSGWLDVGGRDQCQGDSGGPLIHHGVANNVIVGVCSWGSGCAQARYPGVNARVSSASDWIVANA